MTTSPTHDQVELAPVAVVDVEQLPEPVQRLDDLEARILAQAIGPLQQIRVRHRQLLPMPLAEAHGDPVQGARVALRQVEDLACRRRVL
eukprot:7386473-Prymnesium_polylepis.1